MKEHKFTLILDTEPNEEESEKLYSAFNDGTLSTLIGVPQIRFHRESATLENAIWSAMADVQSAGFHVTRVEMEPEMLANTA